MVPDRQTGCHDGLTLSGPPEISLLGGGVARSRDRYHVTARSVIRTESTHPTPCLPPPERSPTPRRVPPGSARPPGRCPAADLPVNYPVNRLGGAGYR